MYQIKTAKLTKYFGHLAAVNQLTLEIRNGEIFGLLGPNGAGKTTTIRILAGLISPSEGSAHVAGYDVNRDAQKIREIIGILTENPSLYDRLSAQENMLFFAEAYGLKNKPERDKRIKELLEYFELWDRRQDKVATFSKGMKQKLAIAKTLVHNPSIIFLDEPTSGLDPIASKNIRDLMQKLSHEEEHTILLSTHRLEDAEKLCHRVLIINQGKEIIIGTPKELEDKIAGDPTLEIKLIEIHAAILDAIKPINQIKDLQVDKSNFRLLIQVDDFESTTPDVIRSIVNANGRILSVQALRPSLESAYLKLVQEDEN